MDRRLLYSAKSPLLSTTTTPCADCRTIIRSTSERSCRVSRSGAGGAGGSTDNEVMGSSKRKAGWPKTRRPTDAADKRTNDRCDDQGNGHYLRVRRAEAEFPPGPSKFDGRSTDCSPTRQRCSRTRSLLGVAFDVGLDVAAHRDDLLATGSPRRRDVPWPVDRQNPRPLNWSCTTVCEHQVSGSVM